MKKRILSIVLTLCMVLMFVPQTVFAANTDATELQNKLDSGGTVTLSKDYTIDTTLSVQNTVTLDLNGHVIKMTGSDSVIKVGSGGNLTMTDSNKTATHTDTSLPAGGVITGSNADQGGGVLVYYGTFTMNGGTIANCSAEYGGGVSVTNYANFNMNGGTIANCSTKYGGGVFISKDCSFTMSGGIIENCTATTSNSNYGGGGVFISKDCSFTMSGGIIENCSAASTFGGGVFSWGNFSMSDNAIIRGCSAKFAGGVQVNAGTFTMTGGTIEACTSTNGTSDAVMITPNAFLLANGGIVKGTVTFSSISAINTTSTAGCTKFYNEATNYGTISGGVYYGGIQNKSSGTVSGTYHTVSFDTNGGSSVPTQWFVNTDKAPALQPADPTKDGYQAFDGWYNGDTKYDFNQPVTQDITLTAKFSNPEAYNISYDLDGGTATNPATYTVESEAITLNNPVKTGYTFTGWSGTDLTGENNMTVTIPKESTGDRSYTAHFSQNTYTVAFDTVGGSSISDKTGVTWTDTVLDGITAPTKDGFEFTGWKCGDMTVDANTKYSNLAANDTVTSVTLVAQWKDIQKPVITGLENGKTYCDAVEFEASDNDGIASVNAGNEVLTVGTNGKYTLAKGVGTVTVVVTDNAGNIEEVSVTVNDGHTYEWQDDNGQYWKKCQYCDDETAKKDIPTITIDGANAVCVTQEYKFSFTLPEGATDAVYGYEFENKGNDGLPAIIENNELFGIVPVTEYEPSENSFKVYAGAKTADGFEFIVSKTVALKSEHTDAAPKDHICDICGATLSEHTGGEATCTSKAICEYCGEEYGEVDRSNHNLENIPAKAATVTETGNKKYWHCLDCGKYFADENGTNEIKLDDTVTQKLPPEIIEGKGQSITAGEKKELTFRSNAAFGDFIRAQLDGKTLDETNYTVREGSTVVTLKADYVATFSVGEHTIGIVSQSGTATTTFTVAKAQEPTGSNSNNPTKSDSNTGSVNSVSQTGDNSNMALWVALLLISGGLMTVMCIYGRKKKHSTKKHN